MKLYYLTIFLLIFSVNCFSQVYSSTSKDSIVLTFLNSKEVIEKGFKFCNKPDTGVLTILDPNNLLVNLNITTWFGHPIQIINKGNLVDSLQFFDAHYLLKDKKNYFIIGESKSKNGVKLYIHHPYDNLINYAKLRRQNNIYFLERIQSGVI